MFWSKKKQSSTVIQDVVEAAKKVDDRVSVAKSEQHAAVKENIEAREHTKNLLKQNGFTLTLYLAVHNPAGRTK